jgi:hypothetical protein
VVCTQTGEYIGFFFPKIEVMILVVSHGKCDVVAFKPLYAAWKGYDGWRRSACADMALQQLDIVAG